MKDEYAFRGENKPSINKKDMIVLVEARVQSWKKGGGVNKGSILFFKYADIEGRLNKSLRELIRQSTNFFLFHLNSPGRIIYVCALGWVGKTCVL